MRSIIATSALILALTAAAPALAKSSQKFETSLSTPISTAVHIEVVIGENLSHRANNMPKKSDDAYSIGRRNAAFAGNGHYGEKELNRLAERLGTRMEKQLAKRGVSVDGEADTVLRLVITDARPNRPTFSQMSKDTNLSFRSFGNGGAAIEGQLIAAGGEQVGEMSYAWYENDIEWAATSATWTDANRALDRFASKTAKTLGN